MKKSRTVFLTALFLSSCSFNEKIKREPAGLILRSCPTIMQPYLGSGDVNIPVDRHIKKLQREMSSIEDGVESRFNHIRNFGLPLKEVDMSERKAKLYGQDVELKKENGKWHEFIIYVKKDKSQRVVKVPRAFFRDYIRPYTYEQFISELTGLLIGEKIGGAKVYRYGETSKLKDDIRGYFYEMEHLFHGQKTFTLKEARGNEESESEIPNIVLNDFWIKVMNNISEVIIKAMELKILTKDLDFIINSKGDVRLLDTSDFTLFGGEKLPRIGPYYIRGLEGLHPDIIAYYKEVMIQKIKSSDKIKEEFREDYINSFRNEDESHF